MFQMWEHNKEKENNMSKIDTFLQTLVTEGRI